MIINDFTSYDTSGAPELERRAEQKGVYKMYTFRQEEILKDLTERAEDNMKGGETISKANFEAINEGLIYKVDILELAKAFGIVDYNKFIEEMIDDLYQEIFDRIGKEGK